MSCVRMNPSVIQRSVSSAVFFAIGGLIATGAYAQAATSKTSPEGRPFIIAPTLEGMYICPTATADTQLVLNVEQANTACRNFKQVGSAAVNQLLDTLEPGGPKGKVQVGYTSTLQLLSLFHKTSEGWKIDSTRVDAFLQLIREVDRPVVVYLAADHFDSIAPLTEELAKDPRNLMQLSDGKPLELGYFGYQIRPWTLLTDPSIPVNKYRYEALDYVSKRILELPSNLQSRIVAITLLGEVHQMFPDFENGMGAFEKIRTTDYSPASVAGFQNWLEARYGTIEEFRRRTGLAYASFQDISAPSKDIRTEPLKNFGEHYDAYAGGTLPLAGWLWDPQNTVKRLDLYVDGIHTDTVSRGFNRLDVYRALEEVTSPNTGYRIDYDYSALSPGKHKAQIIAISGTGKSLIGETDFVVVPRDQSRISTLNPKSLRGLSKAKNALPGVRTYMDLPKSSPDIYYNPLARDWNTYRESEVYGILNTFYERALKAGLPKDKLYSHQIVPNVNSSWNADLFAAGSTLTGDTPWKQGLNMYGGATDSPWMHYFLAQRKIKDYGVPEFNPQQWKREGVHLAAMQSHLQAGARFISPYYFSVVPQRFKADVEHGVNRMELSPTNTKDGSDKFYRAIIEFAKR